MGKRRPICKVCRSLDHQKNKERDNAKNREWYIKNYESLKIHRLKYREKNKEAYLNTCRIYYLNNKLIIQEKRHIYYLNNKASFYIRGIKWRQKNKLRYVAQNKRYYHENRELILQNSKNYYYRVKSERPEQLKLKNYRRRAAEKELPNELCASDIATIFCDFDNKCALTGADKQLELDHFIPINWGFGGTIKGNIYPLAMTLNRSKGIMNPFEWVKVQQIKETIDTAKWLNLVNYLACQNDMSIHDFTEYVYSCEKKSSSNMR